MPVLQRKDVSGNGAGGRGAQRAVGEPSAGAAGRAAPAAQRRAHDGADAASTAAGSSEGGR